MHNTHRYKITHTITHSNTHTAVTLLGRCKYRTLPAEIKLEVDVWWQTDQEERTEEKESMFSTFVVEVFPPIRGSGH